MPRRKRYTHAPKRKRSILKPMLVLFFVVLFVVALGSALAGAVLVRGLPNPFEISERKVAESTKIYDRTGKILLYEVHGEEKRTIVPFDRISQRLKDATIVAEDFNFYTHAGVDVRSILRAVFIDVLSGTKAQGGSTITQQLVKNAFLTPEKTITRKIKEAILSYKIEKSYTKEEIFTFYLNQIPYGSNAYGTEAAAQTFFGTSAAALTLNEAALLAALPKAPSYYSPYGQHKEKLIARKNNILDRMRKVGFITDQDLSQAKQELLVFQKQRADMKAPHFVAYVKNYLEEKYGANYVENAGLKVYTTLDYELQKTAEEIIARSGEENEKKYGAHNAALAAIDPSTGQLLTMVGSRDYFALEREGNYNVTTSKNRQPGSSFKPIAYAAFLQKGFTPDTVLFDVKTEFSADPAQSYAPSNYDERFRGPVSAKSSLAQSLNVPSVQVLYLAGIEATVTLAHAMGVTTLNDLGSLGLSLVLGGGEVPPLDMAYAYGVFANDGVRQEKTFLLKIEDAHGKTIEKWTPKAKTVLEPNIARTITSILSDNTLRSPVFGERSPLFFENAQVAAKTGTTQNYRDAWVVGYTPSISAAIWVGNNDGTSMAKGGAGIAAAGPIFHAFMEQAIRIKGSAPFFPPDPIQSAKPLLNGDYIGEVVVEIDKDSQKLITARTPPNKIEKKAFKEIHSVLHYIDKNDPLGEAPKNPQDDSQYYNWEVAVRDWIAENKTFSIPLNIPPTQYDDIHTELNTPRITVVEPLPYTAVSDAFYARVSVSSPFTLKEVSFFLEDALAHTDSAYPYEAMVDASALPVGPHTLTVHAYDIYDNVGSYELPFMR